MKLITLSLMVLMIVSGCGTKKKNTESKGIVKGKVYLESQTDNSGIQIKIGELTTTTLSDGSYILTDVPSGSHTLIVSKEKYIPIKIDVEVKGGTEIEINDINLKLDTIPPDTVHTPINWCEEGMDIIVKAVVIDNVGVDKVSLFYKWLYELDYTEIPMICTDNNYYTAQIPGEAVKMPSIEYYIFSVDINGNKSKNGPHKVVTML